MINNLEMVFKQCVTLTDPINIIIANGEPPKDEYLLRLLKQADCILCCDGAINILEQNNVEPNYIVGDCDSLSVIQKQKYAAKIRYFPDQNFNDLSKAVDFALNELQLDSIIILAATGLREDHSLANIVLLAKYAEKIKNIVMLSDCGFFRVYEGKAQISALPNQQVSLFVINHNTQITTHGLKWDLDKLTLDNWHKGTLNQAVSTSFELDSTYPVLVYQSFELKSAIRLVDN